jgi:hypothetical protein
MYKTILVETDIQDGERVIAALEESGLNITAAFWSPSEDEDDWYLVAVSSDVAERGGTEVYKQAHATLDNLEIGSPRSHDFWWDRIKIISPSSLIYLRLKDRAGAGDSPVRPGWALGSYIYKLT